MARAKSFFAKLGVSPEPLHDDQVTFQLKLGRDVDRATELTLSVFRDVYCFPPSFELGRGQEAAWEGGRDLL